MKTQRVALFQRNENKVHRRSDTWLIFYMCARGGWWNC